MRNPKSHKRSSRFWAAQREWRSLSHGLKERIPKGSLFALVNRTVEPNKSRSPHGIWAIRLLPPSPFDLSPQRTWNRRTLFLLVLLFPLSLSPFFGHVQACSDPQQEGAHPHRCASLDEVSSRHPHNSEYSYTLSLATLLARRGDLRGFSRFLRGEFQMLLVLQPLLPRDEVQRGTRSCMRGNMS